MFNVCVCMACKVCVWKYSYFQYLQKIVVNKWVVYRQVNLQKMSVSITSENEPAEMAERVDLFSL